MSNKAMSILFWILRIVPAVLLLQTLFFKFTAAPESVAIFSQLGIEPWGRIGIGVAELIAAILLLVPRTTANGALLTVLLMLGALGSHVTHLGFAGEMGSLAVLAVITLVCSLAVAVRFREELVCNAYTKLDRFREKNA